MTIYNHELFNAVKSHMYSQPFKIKCKECGETIEYEREVNTDLDLILKITPCQCQTNKIEELEEIAYKLGNYIVGTIGLKIKYITLQMRRNKNFVE